MGDLTKQVCVACEGGIPPLTDAEIADFMPQLSGWKVAEGKRLIRKWMFPDFASALKRVDAIGALAEREGHHPDIRFGWGYLEITLSTHAIGGLHTNDFILAAKIDALQK